MESQVMLMVIVKCFKEQYRGSLDVKYMNSPTEAEKNWTFRKKSMIVVGVLGFIFGFLRACVIGAHRTISGAHFISKQRNGRMNERASQFY